MPEVNVEMGTAEATATSMQTIGVDSAHLKQRYLKDLVKSVGDSIRDGPIGDNIRGVVQFGNDRSPLVRVVSETVGPIVQKVKPVVEAAIDTIDNRVDGIVENVQATKQKIMTTSSQVVETCVARTQGSLPALYSEEEKEAFFNKVSSTVDRTKSGVCSSANVVIEMSLSVWERVLRRKEQLLESSRTAFNQPMVQENLNKVRQQLEMVRDLLSSYYSNVKGRLGDAQQRFILFINEDSRMVALKESAVQRYQAACLVWTSGYNQVSTLLLTARDSETLKKMQAMLQNYLQILSQSSRQVYASTSTRVSQVLARVNETRQALTDAIPISDERKEFVTQSYVKLYSYVWSALDSRVTETSDNLQIFVRQNSVATWLKSAITSSLA